MLHTVSNEHLLCHCVSRVINLKTELLVRMFLFIYKNKTAHTPSSLAPFFLNYIAQEFPQAPPQEKKGLLR